MARLNYAQSFMRFRCVSMGCLRGWTAFALCSSTATYFHGHGYHDTPRHCHPFDSDVLSCLFRGPAMDLPWACTIFHANHGAAMRPATTMPWNFTLTRGLATGLPRVFIVSQCLPWHCSEIKFNFHGLVVTHGSPMAVRNGSATKCPWRVKSHESPRQSYGHAKKAYGSQSPRRSHSHA